MKYGSNYLFNYLEVNSFIAYKGRTYKKMLSYVILAAFPEEFVYYLGVRKVK